MGKVNIRYKQLLENDKAYRLIIIFIFSLFLFRILNLDCDLPAFGISYYQPIDEGLYSKMAINLYKYDSLVNTGDFALHTAPNYRVNILGNFMQFIALKIFGNNYYGFRLAYVLLAGITLFFIFKSSEILLENYKIPLKISRMLTIGILIYMILDFSYLMMSRTVENSNLRAFSLALSLYIFVGVSEKCKYFFVTLIGVTSIFLIYYSNIVIVVAIFFVIFNAFLRKEWKHFKNIFLQSCLGAVTGVGIAEVYYLVVWKSEAFSNLFHAIFDFSERINANQSFDIIKNSIKGLFLFFNSNMFFYGFGFLALSLLALFFNIIYTLKKNDEIFLFINSSIVWGVLQSVLTQDWMERKAIVFYPALILNLILFVINVKSSNITEKRTFLKRVFYIIFGIFLLTNIYTMFRLHVNYGYIYDFEKSDLIVVVLGIVIQFLVFMMYLYKRIFHKKIYRQYLLGILITSGVVVNLFFSAKYVYFYPKYDAKNTMKQIGEVVGDTYIGGPYAYGFSLYNDCKMIPNTMEDTSSLVKDGYVEYVLDYSNAPFYANQIIPEYSRELVYESQHSIQVYGSYKDIGLYKKTE